MPGVDAGTSWLFLGPGRISRVSLCNIRQADPPNVGESLQLILPAVRDGRLSTAAG